MGLVNQLDKDSYDPRGWRPAGKLVVGFVSGAAVSTAGTAASAILGWPEALTHYLQTEPVWAIQWIAAFSILSITLWGASFFYRWQAAESRIRLLQRRIELAELSAERSRYRKASG